MDLDRLDLFLKIVDSGSMTAASRAAHRTQPTLSRALKVLEDEIGAELFVREGRTLVLTDAGRALVPAARQLLADRDRTVRQVSRVAARGYSDLRLGAIDSIATFLLPHVLLAVRQEFDGLQIKLHTGRSGDLLAALQTGELDYALVASSGAPEGFTSTRIQEYFPQYYGRKDLYGDLADMTDEAQVKARFPIVAIGRPERTAAEAMQSYAHASNVAAVKQLVVAGFGVGGLLEFMLSPDERKTLARAKVPHDPECAVYLVEEPATAGMDDRGIVDSISRRLCKTPRPARR